MSERMSKAILVAAMALYMTIIVWNNLTDYGANFAFVQHVLSMDTMPPSTPLRGRAITSPALHHLAYGIIIAWEAFTAGLCWYGAVRLLQARQDGLAFRQARGWATWGLVSGLLLWVVGFLVIGGEWFAMWISREWNGQQAALRMLTVTGITLIYLHQGEPAMFASAERTDADRVLPS